MNRTILTLTSDRFSGNQKELAASNFYIVLDLIAKEILSRLSLRHYPVASVFSFRKEPDLLLEIKDHDLTKILLGEDLFDGEKDIEKHVDLAVSSVLGVLGKPLEETPLGKSIIRAVSSAKRDLDIKLKTEYGTKTMQIPRASPAVESRLSERAIYMVDTVSRVKSRCTLISCESNREYRASFDPSGSVKSRLEQARSEGLYTELLVTSVLWGGKLKPDSLVVKEVFQSFDEAQFLALQSEYINRGNDTSKMSASGVLPLTF